jgi:tRNA dimethylallyltransferase
MTSATSPIQETAVIAGPTASGKTDLTIRYAHSLQSRGIRAEIINADSLLFYRGFDIGTAKPTPAEQAGIPHHGIDLLEPNQQLTAGDFARWATQTRDEIHARGARAILVGGSTFYLKALISGIWDAPKASPEIRARLESKSNLELWQTLSRVDAVSADRIGPGDRYRLIRALEIFEQSGKTPTQFQNEQNATPPNPQFVCLGIDREPEELEQRLRVRIQKMIDQGWVQETESLRERWPGARSLGSSGYCEIVRYLDQVTPSGRNPRPGIEGLIDEITLSHRQLVKKQRTSLKSQLGGSRYILPEQESELIQELDRIYIHPERL